MTINRQREKVRKLLALAESNNPHEAERALSQAKKIMAKYNIKADDTEIVTVDSSKVPRRYLKDFETHMIGCIKAVSGCEAFMKSTYLPEGKVETTVCFVGLECDANMAAYSFEVLHTQVRQFQVGLKKNGYDANDRNRASLAWSIAACEKLQAMFDYKEIPDHVRDYYERESEDYNEGKSKPSAKLDDSEDSEKDQKLLGHGYYEGQKARLNKATSHQKQDTIA